jgi:hypothetical protein
LKSPPPPSDACHARWIFGTLAVVIAAEFGL